MNRPALRHLLAGASSLLALTLAAPAFAADKPAAPAESPKADSGPIGNADDILVTGTKVNQSTPITASIHTFEPQAIVSRSIIEDSVPATADFSDVILLTPSASGTSNGGGPGFSESKTVLRGFQDGFYNITYDGVPFGDSNNPTHHSTAYFPDGTYERIIVDRGPGSATDLGQASFGGNIHLISREAANKPFVEGQAVYGSYNSFLGRLTYNSGRIERLGGLKMIAVGEWKQTDTALTGSSAWFANAFIKLEKDLGNDAKLSFVSSYNQDFYHQSDNNGATCTAGAIKGTSPTDSWPVTDGSNCDPASQVGRYGKGFGLVNFNDPQFAGSPWTTARSDWNWTRKVTDFEILRLQWNFSPAITIDNKIYSYFYKNFTLSSDAPGNTTTPCAGTITQTTCSVDYAQTTPGTGPGGSLSSAALTALKAAPNGDIGGFSKLNQYRTSGDILTVSIKAGPGTLKVGGWFEHSTSHRYGYSYDLTKGYAAGAFGDGSFSFSQMSNYFNFAAQSSTATNIQLNGTAVPSYVRYDEYTSWNEIQGYAEYALKLFDDRLTITPGIKVQNFTRKIDTPIASQTARVGIRASDSYKPTLPYFAVNYLARPNWSFYAQYAKGFLIPQLSDTLEAIVSTPTGTTCVKLPAAGTNCNPDPIRTTNYQAGTVFAGDRFNLDADFYYIKATGYVSTNPGTSAPAVQTGDPASYWGVEAQVSYVLTKQLTMIANGSWMNAKNDVTHTWLSQAPNMTATIGAVFHSDRFKLSYIHKFTGRQFADAPAWTATQPASGIYYGCANGIYCTSGQLVRIAPYGLGTLAGSVRVFGGVWLGATVYNVFDDASTTKIGGSSKSGTIASGSSPVYFFQPGRSYQLQIKARF